MLASKLIDALSGYVPLEDFPSSENLETADGNIVAASNTVKALRDVCNPEAQKRLKLDVSSFVLILESGVEEKEQSGDHDAALRLVKDIAEAARDVAATHACSSVLAGHASESDDYADIGLLLTTSASDIDPSVNNLEENAKAVLSSLGLESLLELQIVPLPISSETLVPPAFRASEDDANVQKLKSLLGKLSRRFAFRVGSEGVVFHLLLGQAQDAALWVGLLGAGTWSN